MNHNKITHRQQPDTAGHIARYCIHTLVFLMSALTASAQANYLSVFGSSGCSSVDQYKMNAAVSSPTSSSFSGIAQLLDNELPPGSTTLTAANSVYSGNGQLLFSVDQNGIYDNTGTSVWDFYSSLGAAVGGYTPQGGALSEICTFPSTNSASNTSYWVVFWATYGPFDWSCSCQYKILRAIRVDIDASGTPSVDYNNDIQLTDADPTYGITFSVYHFDCAIAADASTCGGGRNVYTFRRCWCSSPTASRRTF